jgi:hypothetical protein
MRDGMPACPISWHPCHQWQPQDESKDMLVLRAGGDVIDFLPTLLENTKYWSAMTMQK